jgi:hypothetical protein
MMNWILLKDLLLALLAIAAIATPALMALGKDME